MSRREAEGRMGAMVGAIYKVGHRRIIWATGA